LVCGPFIDGSDVVVEVVNESFDDGDEFIISGSLVSIVVFVGIILVLGSFEGSLGISEVLFSLVQLSVGLDILSTDFVSSGSIEVHLGLVSSDVVVGGLDVVGIVGFVCSLLGKEIREGVVQEVQELAEEVNNSLDVSVINVLGELDQFVDQWGVHGSVFGELVAHFLHLGGEVVKVGSGS